TPGLRGLRAWSDLPHASSLCGACREVCPIRLDIPRMLLSLRQAGAKDARPRSLRPAMKLFAWTATRPAMYRRAGGMARWWLRRRARSGWIGSLPGLAGGWTRSRDLKAPPGASFQEMWRARQRERARPRGKEHAA